MLVTLKFIIIILINSSCLTVKFKWRQENSILLTFLSIGLLLYLLGLFNIMRFGIYFIIIFTNISLVFLLYSMYKKQLKVKEIFTLGTLLYIFVLLIVSMLLKNTYYIQWDEFSHWGSNLKAMFVYDVLWASNLYDGVHVVYPPLAGIIEYFMCKLNGSFSEAASYFGINAFIITLFIPLLKELKYKIKDVIIGMLAIFCLFCTIFIFGFRFTSIYIDLLLGILFAIGLYLAFIPNKQKEEKILIPILLVSLALVKDTGLLLAGIILIEIGINTILLPIIKNRTINKEIGKNILVIFILLFLIVCFYGSWKFYCKTNEKVLDDRHDANTIDEINISQFVKAVFQIDCLEEKLVNISNGFYHKLNSTALISRYPFTTAIQILVVLNLVGIVLYTTCKNQEVKRRIVTFEITMNVGFVLYCLFLMATYMFVFTEQDAKALASYERYMSTYFIAWVTALLAIILKITKRKLKVFIIITLLCFYGMNIQTLIKPTKKGISSLTQEIIKESNIILNQVKITEKVYIIYQQSNGEQFHQLRYCISPIKTNLLYEWSLGKPKDEGFVWNYDISKEEWEQKLIEENFQYVFIARSDENFVERYGELFAKDINLSELENKLFKVEKTSEKNVKLVMNERREQK